MGKGTGDITMSYDIRLKDHVTDETLDLPVKHVMTGGTYQADYDEQTRTFSPKPISEAWLNVTYNYGRYYYDARLGTSNWSNTTWEDFRKSSWFLDGCDDASDRSYCDIYAKIDPESI